ncbi:hypothetical protein AXW67_29720 [Bradyrhizobium neotropicale]|uniref:Uncharacterized protein n=1 Tax=Bradyrhizobium neotropicale TaxID=1497615 RepID=A0A176YLU7_9BRAD|nr:hypothetical protein AXW67_29720 [Bradyrhizobium neotropicale]
MNLLKDALERSRQHCMSAAVSKRKPQRLNGNNAARPQPPFDTQIKFPSVESQRRAVGNEIAQIDDNDIIKVLVVYDELSTIQENNPASGIVEGASMPVFQIFPAYINQLAVEINHRCRLDRLMA